MSEIMDQLLNELQKVDK
ncbi:hypothetical protein [Priestia megaterium]|nr:hypothetical protein [Priestia megaterium]